MPVDLPQDKVVALTDRLAQHTEASAAPPEQERDSALRTQAQEAEAARAELEEALVRVLEHRTACVSCL